MAPIRSIIATALGKGAQRPIHLYFGVRAERDVYAEEELREWERRHTNLTVHIVLSDEAATDQLGNRRYGFVSDAVRADFASFAGFQAYLAGPPVMVDAATELLIAGGIAARDIHADAFYSAVELAQKVAV